MKARLKNLIHDLRLSEYMPFSEFKTRQIEDFFDRISELNNPDIIIDDEASRHIRYREMSYDNREEDISISIVVVQTSQDDMIVIDADFGDEEE